MPNLFRRPFGHSPAAPAVHIDRGVYTMAMADGENAEITMYGEIVEVHPTHWWTGEPLEGDFIVQGEFLSDLEALSSAKVLTIRMHSIGGDAGVSILIHNRLREMSAKGTYLICVVDGVAMSGGSLIMCACDEIRVNPSSLIMIHNAALTLHGGYNANELRQTATRLDAWDKAQVSIYRRKCSLSDTVISHMMANTTYMTGSEAVEKGFADTLLENAEPLDIAASADGRSLYVRGRPFHLTPGMFAPDTIPTVKAETTQDAFAPVPDKTNTNQPAQTGGQNGGNIMAKTLEELRKEDPALAEQLMAEARAAVSASGAQDTPAAPPAAPAQDRAITPSRGYARSNSAQPLDAAVAESYAVQAPSVNPIQAERKRIQEIDAVAALFDAATVQEAKYGENPCTAQEMTYRAAQKAAQQGRKFLVDMNEDYQASGARNVPAAGDPGSPPPAEAQTPDQRMASARAEVRALFGKEEK